MDKVERMKKKRTCFNKNLKYFRISRGLKGMELAQLIGIPYQTYNGYETKNREPSFAVLIKIANALNVTIDELLLGNNIRQQKEQKMIEQLSVMKGLMEDNIQNIKELLSIIEAENEEKRDKILKQVTKRIDTIIGDDSEEIDRIVSQRNADIEKTYKKLMGKKGVDSNE